MSKAYYNEFDKFAAAWLRELIKEKLIADGDVDERDIRDVTPKDLDGYTQCHFFAGIGGWSYALRLAGWPDSRPVWTGSCPCQPYSEPGKRLGNSDDRHQWPNWFPLIKAHKPICIFGEQVSAAIRYGWLDLVFDDLEGIGYSCGAADFPACSVGAPHKRNRLYFVADSGSQRDAGQSKTTDFGQIGSWGTFGTLDLRSLIDSPFMGGSCYSQPLLRQVDDGFSSSVGLLGPYGNAIVPQQAAAFIQAYLDIVQ